MSITLQTVERAIELVEDVIDGELERFATADYDKLAGKSLFDSRVTTLNDLYRLSENLQAHREALEEDES